MTEFEKAKMIAEAISDAPLRHPNDDACVLSRQFLLLCEKQNNVVGVAPLEVGEYDSMKINLIRVFNLIEDILYEAQNNPLRLVAFNSPLLGIALLEAWKHKNLHASAEEWQEVERQISEFRAVVEANRKRENGI